MNKRIQVGTIVKFLDKDGRMNGGTIVTFKDGKALINTLEGDRIAKDVNSLTPLERSSKVGRLSNQEKESFINKINEYNKEKGYNIVVEKEKETKDTKINGLTNQVQNQEKIVGELREELNQKNKKIDDLLGHIVDLETKIACLKDKLQEKDLTIKEMMTSSQEILPKTTNVHPLNIPRVQIAYEGLKDIFLSDKDGENTVAKLVKTIDKLVSLDNN